MLLSSNSFDCQTMKSFVLKYLNVDIAFIPSGYNKKIRYLMYTARSICFKWILINLGASKYMKPGKIGQHKNENITNDSGYIPTFIHLYMHIYI